MQFLKASTVVASPKGNLAPPIMRSKLDKVREELCIPWRELNKLAKEVIGREFRDCRELTGAENKRFRMYLERNRVILMNRYRKVVWDEPI